MKNNRVNAVIFDMDGLMLDTERVGREAWKQAGKEWNYTITDNDYQQVVGRTIPDAEIIFRGIFGEDFPFYDIRGRRMELVREYFAQHGVPIKPGLLQFLDLLESNAIPKAVATSTGREHALEKLTGANLADRFEAIVTGDEIQNGKPAPDIFIAAAQKLKAAPEKCMVLEDSEAGILAARAAGMIPVMVPDLKLPSEEIRRVAYRVAGSLHEAREIFLQHKGK